MKIPKSTDGRLTRWRGVLTVIVALVQSGAIANSASTSQIIAAPLPAVPPTDSRPITPVPPAAISYGTQGTGNPKTADCAAFVAPGGSINASISAARPGAIICVRPGDHRSEFVRLDKPRVTVRANGVVQIKAAEVTGDRSTLDGFTVVGGTYGDPDPGILFAGDRIKIVNNLVNGDELQRGIVCVRDKCDRGLVSGNTVSGIENIGIFIDAGTGTVVEHNNIYGLHSSRPEGDVDGIRFWGHHIFRYNYIHDINEAESAAAHVDCFQTYNNGTDSSGTLIEDNYCVRVSRQCLIAQNNRASRYEIRNITFRNNVCETYDSQGINLGSMRGVVLENNLIISGYRYQIVNLEVMGGGLPNTNTTIRNNILVRVEPNTVTYRRPGPSTGERFTDNLELLDTSLSQRDDDFRASRGPYQARTANDFTWYRRYARSLNAVDRGARLDHACTDVDGLPRISGRAIDLGPFELS